MAMERRASEVNEPAMAAKAEAEAVATAVAGAGSTAAEALRRATRVRRAAGGDVAGLAVAARDHAAAFRQLAQRLDALASLATLAAASESLPEEDSPAVASPPLPRRSSFLDPPPPADLFDAMRAKEEEKPAEDPAAAVVGAPTVARKLPRRSMGPKRRAPTAVGVSAGAAPVEPTVPEEEPAAPEPPAPAPVEPPPPARTTQPPNPFAGELAARLGVKPPEPSLEKEGSEEPEDPKEEPKEEPKLAIPPPRRGSSLMTPPNPFAGELASRLGVKTKVVEEEPPPELEPEPAPKPPQPAGDPLGVTTAVAKPASPQAESPTTKPRTGSESKRKPPPPPGRPPSARKPSESGPQTPPAPASPSPAGDTGAGSGGLPPWMVELRKKKAAAAGPASPKTGGGNVDSDLQAALAKRLQKS